MHKFFLLVLLLSRLVMVSAAQSSNDYFKIIVVDEATARGVPLVELKTTSEAAYYTDSNGIIAFYEPVLMGRDVYFHVKSHIQRMAWGSAAWRSRSRLAAALRSSSND